MQFQKGNTASSNFVCTFILIVLPVIIFWPVASGWQVWAVGDLASYQVPMNTIATEQWRQGSLPLWDPYLNGGTPLAAAQNPGIFYPINVLLWLLLPAWLMLGYSVLISLALTGLGTFLFLRSLSLHPLSALLGGIVFELSGFAMSHLGHPMILRALPWIGFTLYAFNSWIDLQKARYLAFISLSTFCLYLSGYPQIIVYASLLISTYCLLARRASVRKLFSAFVAFILGILMSALQWSPGAGLWLSKEYLRPGEGMYSVFTSMSFHPMHSVTLLFARARLATGAEMVGYIGVIPLFLGLLAMITAEEGEGIRIHGFFMFWAAISLSLSFGGYLGPLAKMTFHIPFYNSFGVVSKHLMEFVFSMSVLAAYGMERLMKTDWIRQVRLARTLGVLSFIAFISLLAVLTPFSGDASPMKWSPRSQIVAKPILLMVAGLSLMVAATWCQRRIRYASLACLIGFTVFDLANFGVPIYSYGLTSPTFYTTPPATIQLLRPSSSQLNPFRVISFEAPGSMGDVELGKELLAANYNATYHAESLIGHEGLQLRRFNEVFEGRIPPWGDVSPKAVEDPQFRALLDLYGVRYLLAQRAQAPLLSRFYVPLGSTPLVSIFENTHARPRLFAIDPTRWQEPAVSPEAVTLTSYEGHRVTGEVDFRQSAVVVHSANYVSGWKATVDGRSVPLILVAGALQGIQVPAGPHHITFSYEPKSFRWGIAISIGSLVGLLVLLSFWTRQRLEKSAAAQ